MVKNQKTNQLLVDAIWIQSLDGQINYRRNDRQTWGSPEDKYFLREKITDYKAFIFGHNTYKIFQDNLPKKGHCYVYTKEPKKQKNLETVTFTNLEPELLLAKISSEYSNVLILGGSEIYSLYLVNNLVDNLCITISMRFIKNGLPAINEPISLDNFSIQEIQKLNSREILIHLSAKKS